MSATTTVVFADLTGSTGVFETLGNEAAALTVTALTQWIGSVCVEEGGRVVKTLGDGVLALFPHPRPAVEAVVRLQREHARRQAHRMQLQIGLASGEIVEVDGDCYGDAVNVASRLSDMSGAAQIWATASVVDLAGAPPPGARFHSLGQVPIRGKTQEPELYRIDWDETASTDMMTLPAFTGRAPGPVQGPVPQASIELRFLDLAHEWSPDELPVHLGRAREAEFVVQDPRVSRLHACIEWRSNAFVLVDLSSFGTCVRFTGAPTELKLRRKECVLHDSGEIALGPDFSDWSVPIVRFALRMN